MVCQTVSRCRAACAGRIPREADMRKIFHRTSSDRLSESITRLDIRCALASIHLQQAASVCVCSMLGSDEASLISFSCLLASKDTCGTTREENETR